MFFNFCKFMQLFKLLTTLGTVATFGRLCDNFSMGGDTLGVIVNVSVGVRKNFLSSGLLFDG